MTGIETLLAKVLAEHDDPPGWTSNEVDRPVYECNCGDQTPALDRDYIGPEDVEWASVWHRAHLAEVLRGDEVVERVAEAIAVSCPPTRLEYTLARAAVAALFGEVE